jgi:hypothetical protein
MKIALIRFVALACLIPATRFANAQTGVGSSRNAERQNRASIETLAVQAPKNEKALSRHISGASLFAVPDSSRSPAKYLLIGAGIGAVSLGVWAGVQASHCTGTDSCMFAGPMVVLSTGAGAVLGALAGMIAYYDNQHEK